MKKLINYLVVAGMVLGLGACNKDDDDPQIAGVFKGPVVQYHDGKVNSWVKLSAQGAPEQLGISIDEDVMENLPTTGGEGGHHNHENSVTINLHPKALENTPFKHIGLDWNPAGHEPEDIYTVPHFDFHFYMMDENERLAIPPFEQNTAAFENFPAVEYFPANYVPTAGGVPQMGKHWVDVTSPELNGAPFTQTFIFGSYNGKVNFYEPMITKKFLEETNSYERSIPQPSKFQEAGYYPSKLKVRKNGKLTEVILDGFQYHQKSN